MMLYAHLDLTVVSESASRFGFAALQLTHKSPMSWVKKKKHLIYFTDGLFHLFSLTKFVFRMLKFCSR